MREPVKWGRRAAIGAIVLVAAALGLLHVVPLSGYIGGIEKRLSDRLQEPVNIGSLRFALFPSPRLTLEHIFIGKAQDARIETATVPVMSLGLFRKNKQFDEIKLSTVTIDQDTVPRMAGWVQPQAGKQTLQIDRLQLSAVTLMLRDIRLPSFEATINLPKTAPFKE